MLHSLRLCTFLLVALCLGLGRPAQATHIMGGDLTYQSLGNNQYVVTLTLFRDCSGSPLPTSMTLNVRNGCQGVNQGSYPMNPVPNTITLGSFYCPAVQPMAPCLTSSTLPNHESQQYRTGIVAIQPGQWTMSTEICCRPSMANLMGQASFRYEATLDSRGGLQNNSPVFSNTAAYNLPWQRLSLFQMGAYDADGDSLVYELVAPLDACSVPVRYAPYPAGLCAPAVLSSVPACGLACTSPTAYSPTFPVAVANDTIGSCPNKTTAPRFQFDAANGAILIEPALLLNTPFVNGENKYVAVVKVSEYRRLATGNVLIGSVRRDLFFTVYNCGANQLPRMAPTLSIQNGTTLTTQPIGQIIAVRSGEPIEVNLAATDSNTGQALNYSLAYNTLPGVALQSTGATTGRLTFTPGTNLRDGIYRVSVSVLDDACPIRGVETRSIAFRVFGSPLGNQKASAAQIAAYPTPFAEQVRFQLATPGVQMLTIADNLGRVVAQVMSQADGKVEWTPGADVPAGLYLARSTDGQQTIRLLRGQPR